MSQEAIYNEFKELQNEMSHDIQDLTTSLVLARDKSEKSLLLDEGLSQHIENSRQLSFKINTCFINMISTFNKAYSSIQNNIDLSIEGLSEIICDQDDKLKLLNNQIHELMNFLTYRNPSNDYTTKAKYMLENIKTENGSTIKGKVINIQNLALILMKYDEMRSGLNGNKNK